MEKLRAAVVLVEAEQAREGREELPTIQPVLWQVECLVSISPPKPMPQLKAHGHKGQTRPPPTTPAQMGVAMRFQHWKMSSGEGDSSMTAQS
jgi:hypothetical protein